MPVPPGQKRERLAGPHPVDLDAVERCPRRTAGPATTEEHDLVPGRSEASENLVQVDLGPTGERIVAALPVHHGNAQPSAGHNPRCSHSLPSLRA